MSIKNEPRLNQPDYYNALKFLESLADLANGNVGKYFSFQEVK